MSDLRTLALRAAALRALADLVKDASDQARQDVQQALVAAGADSVTAKLDDQPVAKVTLAGGKPTARVADEAAFLTWVRLNAPTEIVMVVREPYRKAVLDAATKAGAPVSDSGEFIPGVEVGQGSPYISTRFAPGGRELVAEAWRDDRLALGDLLPQRALGGAE